MKTQSDSQQARNGTVKAQSASAITDFLDLFITEIKNLWSVEKMVVDSLRAWAKTTQNPTILHAMAGYLDLSKARMSRLERVLDHFGHEPHRALSTIAQALAQDGEATLGRIPAGALRDAAAIMVLQRVMHHKITGYGTLCAYAELLKKTEAESLASDALIEEWEADETFTEMAISSINARAAMESMGKSRLLQPD
jgi:ferritin-like metal-binding protein YciE